MSTFSNVSRNRAPSRTVLLRDAAWAHDYRDRPNGDLAVGLRLLSEADIQTIKRESVKYALDLYSGEDGRPVDLTECNEAYNDALVRWVVGRSCCDPNDVEASFFKMEEETVRRGLTSDGARWMFDEYNRFRRETSPTQEQATAADLQALAVLLLDGERNVGRLSKPRQVATLKLLRGILDELRAPDAADGAGVEDDEFIIDDED